MKRAYKWHLLIKRQTYCCRSTCCGDHFYCNWISIFFIATRLYRTKNIRKALKCQTVAASMRYGLTIENARRTFMMFDKKQLILYSRPSAGLSINPVVREMQPIVLDKDQHRGYNSWVLVFLITYLPITTIAASAPRGSSPFFRLKIVSVGGILT